jgi:catechol 2,3-dioxygenase-like lactoylglutathione lyase family enzyme
MSMRVYGQYLKNYQVNNNSLAKRVYTVSDEKLKNRVTISSNVKVRSLTPVIATNRLIESRDFYIQHLGFQVIFENDWYVQLRSSKEPPIDIAFVLPNLDVQPPIFRPAFSGKGVIYTIEVEDVKSERDRLIDAGLSIVYDLHDEPWGERHFAIIDPNGVTINISQMIEPAKEYLQYFR